MNSTTSHLMERARKDNPGALEKITEAQQTLLESPVDIYGLCKRIGVPTERREDMPHSLSGFIYKKSEDELKIYYNGNHPETRQRFTVGPRVGALPFAQGGFGRGIPRKHPAPGRPLQRIGNGSQSTGGGNLDAQQGDRRLHQTLPRR